MGTLFSALDIARSGIQAAQIQIDVAAHNIANVNKEGFSRQRATLVTQAPNIRPFGQLGRGVRVAGIERLHDPLLDRVYRQQVSSLGEAEVQQQFFNRLEDIFLEPTENGFSARLSSFFDALQDFSNNVEDTPVRQSVISEAEALSGSLREVAQRLFDLRTNANEEVQSYVPEINSLAERIAALNERIRSIEGSGQSANDLRDDRDVLLDELGKIVNISYNTRLDGQVDVLVGGDVLVDGSETRYLEAVRTGAVDPSRPDFVQIRFVETNNILDVRSGELMGAMNMRDAVIPELDERLDEIAATIIESLNSIQTQGNGLVNWSGTVSSTNLAINATTPLISAGLPFDVSAGSFDVVVYDAAGNAVTTTVTVDATTTLNDLATALNAIPNFNASVTGSRLDLGTTGAYTFGFRNDSSNILTALGITGVFTGYDAQTIQLNSAIADNPSLLASRYSTDATETGDNTAALDMAGIRTALLLDGNSTTILGSYETMISELGVDARANSQTLEVEEAFIEDIKTRRMEVSSVSLDEEVTNMLQFQRAFEASARVITIVDRMLETLIAAVQ